MRVRLTKKLADEIDGINLAGHNVGDVLELPPAEAELLVAEGWATPERQSADRPRQVSYPQSKSA
jgi:hypothetical protein